MSASDQKRYLTRHQTESGPRWAANGRWLPDAFHLDILLQRPLSAIQEALGSSVTEEAAEGPLIAPIEDTQEVWAAGVTYLRSRKARVAESSTADLYQKVYEAERVEVFFKAIGWRVLGEGDAVRIRRDSDWNVPEPELTLLINRAGEIVGYTAGNDISSRDIEGQNPLYLPQAKIYDGSCALGPGIIIASADAMRALPIRMRIERSGDIVFDGETSTAKLKRSLEEMAGWLTRELSFPEGAFLMTGTGLVPPDAFSLAAGDSVRIHVGDLTLENRVG
ncbi:MAG: fumarylacetoacetate hydrolase family protein [Gammaproteobacteria bacterium]|nr:fumarylacetoacetate hydrolase family protein [Gammaproteobacteria bacterium]